MTAASHRIPPHAAALLAASFAVCAPLLRAASLSSALVPVHSALTTLPESILRETYAAIERARAHLVKCQDADGLWTRDDGTRTLLPALALCDPVPDSTSTALDAVLAAADSRAADLATKPWTPQTTAEAFQTALFRLLHTGQGPAAPLAARLARARLDALPQDAAALALMALDSLGAPRDGGWAGLVNRLRAQRPADVESVAIAGLARFNSGRSQDELPTRDVLEHLRWIAAQARLGAPRRADDPEPVTPAAAFFIAALASKLPRSVFAEDPGLLPYAWRGALANRLIARQRMDPATGLGYWDASPEPDPTSDNALRDTAYAVMTLVVLAE